MPDFTTIDDYLRQRAADLRGKDQPAATLAEWDERKKQLRAQMFAAMGPIPTTPCDLTPKILGTLERDGYRIEKLIYQTRPDVWATATAYVPTLKDGQKVPAVLVVHGHWSWARRDPVVQARCLGLVKLGFFVLAVDAFGAGERYTNPAKGTYHGSLYGATLWPVGHSLLGMQVYDNRRAVDYLETRKEVNGKFGVTGASGGGNQSMYAGALDERFQAVVPVCSVGNYQVYLKTACCVCEVLPAALSFTEEGDVLGLVAPRALMVTSAAKDGIQFSPDEAKKSLARAKDIFALHKVDAKLTHVVVDSGHDYNQPMREAMYGWMTLHLKGEGKGEPIAEPKFKLETPEDLACFPNLADRPKGFLTPPLFAAKVARELTATHTKRTPDHREMWDADRRQFRSELTKLFGPLDKLAATQHSVGDVYKKDDMPTWSETCRNANGVGLAIRWLGDGKKGNAYVLHFGTTDDMVKHPLVVALVKRGYRVALPDLSGLGATKPKADAIAGAPDHNSAEHAVWLGEPLLKQWVRDVGTLLGLPSRDKDAPVLLAGVGPAGVIALAAGALYRDTVQTVVTTNTLASFITEGPYAACTPMGLLAPNLLRVADVPQLAALIAPRRLIIAAPESAQGKKLTDKEFPEAFAFTTSVYKALQDPENLTLTATADWNKVEW